MSVVLFPTGWGGSWAYDTDETPPYAIAMSLEGFDEIGWYHNHDAATRRIVL